MADKSLEWNIESSTYVVNDQWMKLRSDRCKTPLGTILDPYYVIESSDWVNIVAVTDENKVLMVKQYRHGIGTTVTELPAGRIDTSDNSPEIAMKRELLEETGYSAENIILTSRLPLNTSNHNNYTYSYLATNVKKVCDPKPDESEQLEILELSFDEIEDLIKNGELQALHTASFLIAQKML